MSSSLDTPLGDLIKQNKKKGGRGGGAAGGRGGGRQGAPIAKGKRQATKQAGTTNQRQPKKGGNGQTQSQKKPRQQVRKQHAHAVDACRGG